MDSLGKSIEQSENLSQRQRESSRTSTVDLTHETHDADVTNTDSIEAQPAAKKQKRVSTRTDDIKRGGKKKSKTTCTTSIAKKSLRHE